MTPPFEILSINTSKKKGTMKIPKSLITINNQGIVKDAHADEWHRQINLLGDESIRKLEYDEFAENITNKGIVLHKTKPSDQLKIDDTII